MYNLRRARRSFKDRRDKTDFHITQGPLTELQHWEGRARDVPTTLTSWPDRLPENEAALEVLKSGNPRFDLNLIIKEQKDYASALLNAENHLVSGADIIDMWESETPYYQQLLHAIKQEAAEKNRAFELHDKETERLQAVFKDYLS